MVICLTMLEIIIIIAAISFVVIVFTKAFINHLHGKTDCAYCESNGSCNGNCNHKTKDEIKNEMKEQLHKSYNE